MDVSEGKTDPLYAAHSYHTKVPYKAIMPAILHYTEPGDVILDGFSGSGMTGVAAQMCREPEPEFKLELEKAWREAGRPTPRWGARRVILGDLSPAATFIAANYNLPFDVKAFEREARRILKELGRRAGLDVRDRSTPTARRKAGSTSPYGARCSPAPSVAERLSSLMKRLTLRPRG